jgi:hypothetical protein
VLVATALSTAWALSNSKLSVHIGGMSSATQAFLTAAAPRLVKILDPTPSLVQAVRAANPGMVVVCRIYLPAQPQSGDPVAAAQAWWTATSSTILSIGNGCAYWEGYNEPDVSSGPAVAWMAAFDVARVQILAQNGLLASVGNFAPGTPDVTNATVIQAFFPAIDAAIANRGILGLHEYASPFMWSCFDNSTGEGWLTGRYRMLYDEFLLPTNRSLPLVVSEGGIDAATCGGQAFSGWQTACAYWASNGWGSDCNNAYVTQLSWYDSVLRADDYVLGVTLFQADCPGWDNYDVTPAYPDLTQYMNSL